MIMKRSRFFILKSLLFTVLLGVTVTVGAQFKAFKKIDEIEVSVGPSFLSIRGSQEVSQGREPLVKLNGGISLEHNLNDKISFIGGIFYGKKGGRQVLKVIYYDTVSQLEERGEIEYVVEFKYLSIPIVVRYNFLKKKILFIEAGPYLGILLRETTTITRLYSGDKNSFDGTENYGNDFGISIGVGLNLPIYNKISLSAKINSNIGLNDVSKLDAKMFSGDVIKTNSTSFLIGINFKLNSL